MSDLEPRRSSGLSRKQREQRAYTLTLATGGLAVLTIALVILAVVGISEDGQWYLLDGGAWIATFLAADTQIANLPIATQELIDQAIGAAPVPAATATVTATAVLTPEVAATPVPAGTVAGTTLVTPTTTTDANLRAGPGTEFPIIGGTISR